MRHIFNYYLIANSRRICFHVLKSTLTAAGSFPFLNYSDISNTCSFVHTISDNAGFRSVVAETTRKQVGRGGGEDLSDIRKCTTKIPSVISCRELCNKY